MATNNNNLAQNKLGELYIDFGMKGLGSLLKGLGGISLGFMAVQKAAGAYIGTMKSAGETAISVRKLQHSLGLTSKESQAIKDWTQLKGINQGAFVGDIENVMNMLTNQKLFGAINSNIWSGIQLLNQKAGTNIDITKYGKGADESVRFLKDIGEALNKITDYGTKQNIIQRLELSNEALDYMAIGVDNYKDIMNVLSDVDIQKSEKAREAMIKVSQAYDKLITAFALKSANPLIKFLNGLTAILTPKENRTPIQQNTVGKALEKMLWVFDPLDMYVLNRKYPQTKSTANPTVLNSGNGILPSLPTITKTMNQTNHIHVDSVEDAIKASKGYEKIYEEAQKKNYNNSNGRTR